MPDPYPSLPDDPAGSPNEPAGQSRPSGEPGNGDPAGQSRPSGASGHGEPAGASQPGGWSDPTLPLPAEADGDAPVTAPPLSDGTLPVPSAPARPVSGGTLPLPGAPVSGGTLPLPAGSMPGGTLPLPARVGSDRVGSDRAPLPATARFPAPLPVIAQIAEIQVTSATVRTPTGEFPLRGSRWVVTDHWLREEKTPTWAIVLAILGLCVIFLFSLLFLLVKQTRFHGWVQVVVSNGPHQYVARIPVSSQAQVQHLYNQVNYVRSLAAL